MNPQIVDDVKTFLDIMIIINVFLLYNNILPYYNLNII